MNARSERGFSITELVVVVLLFAAAASLAIPQIQSTLDQYRLAASANLVAAELSAGRALAISRNWVYEVHLDDTNRTIQIIDPDNASNNPRIVQTLDDGITFVLPLPAPRISFYSRGNARGGTITLQNQNGDTISIQVNGAGKVQIS